MKGSSIPREAEAPVASLLSEMEKELLGILKNTELSSYFQESFLASGKRIRPLFFFLLSGSLGASRPDLADYGLILELLHASSLIHDDIIDHSDQRRGMASFNNTYGNQTAVFLGDFLMWATQKLALSKGDLKLLELLNQRGEEMLLGEVQEIRNHRNLRLSPGEYGEIITRKTGSLFLLAAQMAAHLSQVAPERGETLERLGTLVGILFQLVDDLLDITSDSGSFGKPVMNDLREGTVTLPLILALRKEPSLTAQAEGFFQNGDEKALLHLHREVRRLGLEESLLYANRIGQEAQALLLSLPDTPFRTGLNALIPFLLERTQ